MNFMDGSLFPENQEKLVITAAPYGPEWMPQDFPEDIPLTMDEHVQKAVDCWNAGAPTWLRHPGRDGSLQPGADRRSAMPVASMMPARTGQQA